MKAHLENFTRAVTLAFLCILCGCSTFKTGETKIVYGPDPNRSIDESKITYFVSPDGDDSKDGKTRQTALKTMQKVFINGKLLAEKNGPYYGAKEIRRDKVIVGIPSNGGQPWRGTIDELTVWDRPLSDEEIADFAKTKN